MSARKKKIEAFLAFLLMQKRELLGFGFQTAYASVTYLDRFLSRRSIDVSWVLSYSPKVSILLLWE